MLTPRHDLGRVQRWMQAVIMHPEGVEAGAGSVDARSHLDVAPNQLERVINRSLALTAEERLAIYNGAYFARLLECLREEFPVLVKAMTREVFDAFAAGYLQRHPSRSYTLTHLGDHFPRYLDETRPSGEEDDGAWPDFLIDLAALELTTNQVFDGPGVEGKQLLRAEYLLAVPTERWPDAKLVPVECLRLLALRYPVHRYFAALRQQDEAKPPARQDTFLAVTRRDFIVRHVELPGSTAYEILRALVNGASVGEAVKDAARIAGTGLDQLCEQLHDWFRHWVAAGFFQRVEGWG